MATCYCARHFSDRRTVCLFVCLLFTTNKELLIFYISVLANPVTMNNSEALRPTPHSGRAKGKLATRLDEVKNPWRQTSTLEFSHNEAARLATDGLLESGEKEYRKVLAEEKELSFLSPLDIRYIIDNANKNSSPESSSNGNDRDFDGDTVSELTSGTYFPMMSDDEPPILELGWPDPPHRFGPSETQIYFQRDKSQNIKDLIRSLISKAKKVSFYPFPCFNSYRPNGTVD